MEVTRLDGLGGSGLWLAPLDGVAAGEWSALYAQMDPQRQRRCGRYRRQTDQQLCILADALARHALSRITGHDPASVVLQLREGGKPFAPGLGVEFSLSHSGALVLCATALFPVGADLQLHRPLTPALTRRMARAGYRGESEADFFSWWVRQEAAGKLTGRGLSLSPLPADLIFWEGALERTEGRYSYCLCARGSSLSANSML